MKAIATRVTESVASAALSWPWANTVTRQTCSAELLSGWTMRWRSGLAARRRSQSTCNARAHAKIPLAARPKPESRVDFLMRRMVTGLKLAHTTFEGKHDPA